jgi:hypothetical protein
LIRGSTAINAVNAIDFAWEYSCFANVANGEDPKMDGRTMEGMKMKTRYADNAKIKTLVKGNPAREGTHSYACFALAKTAKTFGAFRLAGGNLKYLYWFQERGKLEIVS